jgi:hypothetical protein
VAKTRKDAHLYELAKLGAQAQLRDLMQEVRLLIDLFPHLKDNIDTDELPVSFILKRGRDRADTKARKKPRWTPAQRQAAAARMKKYWATRRNVTKKIGEHR